MRLSLLVSALLVSPAHFFLAPSARPCASSQLRAPSVLRARMPIGMASEEDEGYYRALGLSDDAGYDEITDAHMTLTEQYAGDQARLDQLDEAKDKVLALMLRKRMEGSLKAEYGGQMAREDRPPVPKTPIWEIVNEFRKKTVGLPARRDALNVFGLIGGLTFATWLAPTTVGTIMLINTVSAMGFMVRPPILFPLRRAPTLPPPRGAHRRVALSLPLRARHRHRASRHAATTRQHATRQ